MCLFIDCDEDSHGVYAGFQKVYAGHLGIQIGPSRLSASKAPIKSAQPIAQDFWLAVPGLNLNDHNSDAVLVTTSPYYGNFN